MNTRQTDIDLFNYKRHPTVEVAVGDVLIGSAILPKYPGATGLKEKLADLGATHTLMSGSGPSVYGIFATENDAVKAQEALTKEGITAFYAQSV